MRKKILTFNVLKQKSKKLTLPRILENRTRLKYSIQFKNRHFVYSQIRIFNYFYKNLNRAEYSSFKKIVCTFNLSFLFFKFFQKNLSLRTRTTDFLTKDYFINLFFTKWATLVSTNTYKSSIPTYLSRDIFTLFPSTNIYLNFFKKFTFEIISTVTYHNNFYRYLGLLLFL
jgi:hypothetical protein